MPVVLIARRARCRKNESFVGVRHLQACARAWVRVGPAIVLCCACRQRAAWRERVCLRIREIEAVLHGVFGQCR